MRIRSSGPEGRPFFNILLGLGAAAFAPLATRADPLKPTLAEINAVTDVLRFRGAMIADPDKAIRTFAAQYAVAVGWLAPSRRQRIGRSWLRGWDLFISTAGSAVGPGSALYSPVFSTRQLDPSPSPMWTSRPST